jgi:hypothetical protein
MSQIVYYAKAGQHLPLLKYSVKSTVSHTWGYTALSKDRLEVDKCIAIVSERGEKFVNGDGAHSESELLIVLAKAPIRGLGQTDYTASNKVNGTETLTETKAQLIVAGGTDEEMIYRDLDVSNGYTLFSSDTVGITTAGLAQAHSTDASVKIHKDNVPMLGDVLTGVEFEKIRTDIVAHLNIVRPDEQNHRMEKSLFAAGLSRAIKFRPGVQVNNVRKFTTIKFVRMVHTASTITVGTPSSGGTLSTGGAIQSMSEADGMKKWIYVYPQRNMVIEMYASNFVFGGPSHTFTDIVPILIHLRVNGVDSILTNFTDDASTSNHRLILLDRIMKYQHMEFKTEVLTSTGTPAPMAIECRPGCRYKILNNSNVIVEIDVKGREDATLLSTYVVD